MRLLEIAPDFVRSQTGTLLTILQHLEATMGGGKQGMNPVTVPMSAITKLMHNAGYVFSYDDFVNLYKTEPRIAGLVDNFNQEQITIGQAPAEAPTDKEKDEKTVDRMAQSAAKNINSR